MPRLLFAAYHSYLDSSSGAALATRDLLELLATHGWACAACTAAVTDFDQDVPTEQLLDQHGLVADVRQAAHAAAPFTLYHVVQAGIPVTLFRPHASPLQREPTAAEGDAFLAVLAGVLDRFRPDLVLTYGGQAVAAALRRLARRRGARVVFHLHNDAYTHRAAFTDVDAVLVPSEWGRRHYHDQLGLQATAVPCPIGWARVQCPTVEPRYLTCINPQPAKGAALVARLAVELQQRVPEVPLLLVEGRSRAGGLNAFGLDLSGLRNLHRLANTADPRQFYQVTRALLVPSFGQEMFGRVAAEALANGIPVLASDRGGLPEVLAETGQILPVPPSYTGRTLAVPTAVEVAPWVSAVERLWRDADYFTEHSAACRAAARRWHPERLGLAYVQYLQDVLAGKTLAPFPPVAG
jgi:glycosyltransferase involved in cell wall biosynthesis